MKATLLSQKTIVTSGPDQYTLWTLEFGADLAGVNLPLIELDILGLTFTNLVGDPPFGSVILATLANGAAGTNEMQTITPSVTLTSGDFQLEFDGETTAPIAFDADGADVESALEALLNIDQGDLNVTGGAGGQWTVDFGGQFAQTDVPTIVIADASNLGGALNVTVADDFIAAVTGTNEVQNVAFNNTPTADTFTLSFDGDTTAPIPFGANGGTVQTALQGLDSVGSGNATVAGGASGPYTVTFQNFLRGLDAAEIVLNTSNLVDQGLVVDVTDDAIEAGLPNEKQRVALPFGVNGGDFTLTLNGETTGPINFDASASDVQTALENLTTPGVGDFSVTGPQKGPWNVEFTGVFANTNVDLMTADGMGLDLEGGTITVEETTKGNNEGQQRRQECRIGNNGRNVHN